MIELEILHERYDHFKCDVMKKISKSTILYNLNLGDANKEFLIKSHYTIYEKEVLGVRFKKYRDVFVWNYDF